MQQISLDEHLKNLKDETLDRRAERHYTKEAKKSPPLHQETLYPLVLAIGASTTDPPEWALRECQALYQQFEIFGKQDFTGWLGVYSNSDPEKLCWAAVHFIRMSRDPTSGKPTVRAAIVKTLGGKDKACLSEIKRLQRRWDGDTKGEFRGYPDNRWIRKALDFLDFLDNFERYYNSETGPEIFEALTDSESEV